VEGKADFDAFQEHVLVPSAILVAIPDGMSFNQAAMLPMTAWTAWQNWYTVGLPTGKVYHAAEKKGMGD
jgi:NADPH:quinone reductase-like Zn-dependent oxidoreductase